MEDGSAFVLESFQQEMLAAYFAGTIETLILIPKKNGKSTLMAALSLFHLCTTPDAECVVGAASRDQATIIYQQAAGFVKRSPGLALRIDTKRGYRELRSRRDAGRIRVLAADADTADGVIPTLAMVDEYHRHKKGDLYGIFRDGLGPRNGRMLTISTAGEDEETTPLGKMRSAAKKLPVQKLVGRHHFSASADLAYVMHEWALLDGDDRDDMNVVKLVNPASWQTTERLRARHDSPSMMPWQWARFACGIWERGEAAAINPRELNAITEPGVRIPPGSAAPLGLDLGWKIDTTAIAPLWAENPTRNVVGVPCVLRPVGDGTMLDERAIVAALLMFHGVDIPLDVLEDEITDSGVPRDVAAGWMDAIRHAVPDGGLAPPYVVYDPNAGGQQVVQQLENGTHQLQERFGTADIVFVEHSQDNAPMAEASRKLEEAIGGTKTLVVPDDPALREHFFNAARKNLGGEQWKYDRPPRGARVPIDVLTSVLFVFDVMTAEAEEPTMAPNIEFW